MVNNHRNQELIELMSNADNRFVKLKPHFQTFEKVFFNELDSSVLESLKARGKSRISFPKARAKCARVSDSLNKAYFSNDNFATISTSGDEEREEYIFAIEKLDNAVSLYTKNMKLFTRLQTNIRKVPYIGTAIAKSYWANGNVALESVDIDTLRFDPDARDPESVTYFCHDIYKTKSEIDSLIKRGVFKLIKSSENLFEDGNKIKSKRVMLTEIYTIQENGTWTVSTYYKEKPLRLDSTLQDGHPFNFGGLLPQLRKIDEKETVMAYYEPLIMPLVPLQEEYNIRRNQQIDAVKMMLNPKLISPKSAGIDPMAIINPNISNVLANTVTQGSIIPVPQPNVQAASFDGQNMDHDMSEISGVSPMMNGVSNDKSKTATEKGIEHSEGSIKLESYVRSLNETFFNPLIQRVAMLVWKYGDAKFFKGVDRRLDLDFSVSFNTGLGVTNDVVKRENLGQAFAMMNKLLDVQMSLKQEQEALITVAGLKKVVKETMPLIGITNADEYLGKENNEQSAVLYNTGTIGEESSFGDFRTMQYGQGGFSEFYQQ